MHQHSDEAIRLTIVHPYDLDASSLLTKQTCRVAKEEAQARLQHWLDMLPDGWPGSLQTETLLGSANLVLTIHVQLRSYDYVLLNSWQSELPAPGGFGRKQTGSRLHYINLPENIEINTKHSGCPIY